MALSGPDGLFHKALLGQLIRAYTVEMPDLMIRVIAFSGLLFQASAVGMLCGMICFIALSGPLFNAETDDCTDLAATPSLSSVGCRGLVSCRGPANGVHKTAAHLHRHTPDRGFGVLCISPSDRRASACFSCARPLPASITT